MKRNIRVLEIKGLRGILTVAYIIICAIAGYIVFPAFMLMYCWNWFSVHIYNLPAMNMLHGFMLYAIIILIYFATKTSKSGFNFYSSNINPQHIATIMKDFDDKK